MPCHEKIFIRTRWGAAELLLVGALPFSRDLAHPYPSGCWVAETGWLHHCLVRPAPPTWRWGEGSVTQCLAVTFRFPSAFVWYRTQQSFHLMCEQRPVLKEAVLSQTPSQQADDCIAKSSMHVAPTELLPAVSGLRGDRWGHLPAFAFLTQVVFFPADCCRGSGVSGACPSCKGCATARFIHSVLEMSVEI